MRRFSRSRKFIFSCCKLTILFHRRYIDHIWNKRNRCLPLTRTAVGPCKQGTADERRESVPLMYHTVRRTKGEAHHCSRTDRQLRIASGAWAQSSVTLYGSLDAGIAYINNAGGHPKWIEEQGNMQPDRWGLKDRRGSGRRTEDRRATGERLLYEYRRVREERRAVESAGVCGPEPDEIGTVTFGHQTPFSFDMLGPLRHGISGRELVRVPPGQHRRAGRHRRRAVTTTRPSSVRRVSAASRSAR